MNISEISIRRPVFAWMLMASLILFGSLCFKRMGISQLPDIDFPVVNVSLNLEGAAPEVMEVDVVDPVEDALMGISDIKNITSSSKAGSANITVEFEIEKNIDVAVGEIQNVLLQVQRRLPKEMDPPSVRKNNPEDQPILWLAISSDTLSEKDLMSFVRDRLKERFSTLPGVAEVFLGGFLEPNLRVWLSAEKLNKYELSVGDVLNTIQSEHTELPSGRLETGKEEFNIRTLGEAPSAEEFSKLTINRRGGAPNFSPLTLASVAQVEDGLADVRRKSRSMGKPAVGLGIKKQRGANVVSVGTAAKKRMEDIQKELPKGTEMGVRFDATKFIEESISELNFTLLLSAIITALVCWLFLGSWSATLNVILAIPTSIIGSFIILYWLNFTLNTFTLLGLSLAIGIVVDDAIMVLENIVRHFEMGKNKMEASIVGSREITFAAIATTAAIIAIFLPVAFMKGIIGKFFFQFGVTLSVAVGLSLLEALTLTPMRCSQFLQIGERQTRLGKLVNLFFEKFAHIYSKGISVALNHRWKTLILATLFFVGSLFFLKILKKEFVPAQDQGSLMIRIQTPIGSSIEYTDTKFSEVEKLFMSRPEVDKYFGSIGGFGGGDVNTAVMFLTLKAIKDRPKNPETKKHFTQQELAALYRKEIKKISNIRGVIQDLSLSGFSSKRGFPVEFAIRGTDFSTLVNASKEMMAAMEKTGLMTDVDSDYLEGMPEIIVVPDREKARRRGVSVYDVAQTINSLMGGVVAGKYSKDGHRYDVRVRLISSEREKAEDISKLRVRNNRGELIALSEVVEIKKRKALASISRQGRERAITVTANISPKSSQASVLETVQKLAKEVLPENYRIVLSGSSEAFKESFQSLLVALVLGLIVAYMVLASQFNSFIHPLTVLLALPFSISGAFIALYLGRQSLNIYSMIGLILLTGIVKKNSILLVDFTNQLRKEGMNVKEALLKACPIRLRPILMTSLAIIAGALPPALAIGSGAESRIPMALAVIGGSFVSTALTLFVVPCAYSLLARKNSQEK